MSQLPKRIARKLRANPVRARLMIEAPKLVTEGWLLRLRCQNPGKPDDFEATIVDIDGVDPTAVGLPWPLGWRGHDGARKVHLDTRRGELIRLAIFNPVEHTKFALLRSGTANESEIRTTLSSSDGIVVTVKIQRGGRVDVEQRVRLASRRNADGTYVPVATFTSYGVSTAAPHLVPAQAKAAAAGPAPVSTKPAPTGDGIAPPPQRISVSDAPSLAAPQPVPPPDVSHLHEMTGLDVATDRLWSAYPGGELAGPYSSQNRYALWRNMQKFPAEYLIPHVTRRVTREWPTFMADPPGHADLSLAQLRQLVRDRNPWYLPFRMRDDFFTMDMTSPLALDAADRVLFRRDLIVGTLVELLGDELADTSVLDIGCNDGFFSLDIAARGAKHVDGIDLRENNISKARFLAEHYGIDNVTFNVSDADAFQPDQQWDLILNLGVLYHVVNPLQFVQQTYELCRKWAVIDTICHTEPISGYVLFGDKNNYKPAEGRETWEFHPTYRGAIDAIRYAGFSEVIEILGDAHPPHPFYASGGRRCFLAIK